MSEIIRFVGFLLLGIMAYGSWTYGGEVNKTRFLVLLIIGFLMIAIGYLGDIADAVKELKPEKKEPPAAP